MKLCLLKITPHVLLALPHVIVRSTLGEAAIWMPSVECCVLGDARAYLIDKTPKRTDMSVSNPQTDSERVRAR